jgi:hypothetical protein
MLCADVTQACSCGKIAPCEAFANADAVFVGRALTTRYAHSAVGIPRDAMSATITTSQPVTRFEILETILGIRGTDVEINGGGTTCDYRFEPNERYLVYANRGDKGKLYASICSRSAPLSKAEEDLAYLRAGKRATGGVVEGDVVRAVFTPGTDDVTSMPLAGARVIFMRRGRRFVSRADAQGHFVLRGAPAGTYSVHTVPRTNSSRADVMAKEPRSRWIIRVPAHGCERTWFTLQPEGVVSGVVVDKSGRRVTGAEVSLATADRSTHNENVLDTATDSYGRFRFTFVPPGSYYLGFNIRGGAFLELPYPEYYHPGATDRRQATVLRIGDGGRVSGLILRRPDPLSRQRLKGIAVYPDGKPAAFVTVELTNPRTGYQEGNGVTTYYDGTFVLTGIEGQTYDLSALVNRGVALVNSKPLRVQLGQEREPVRLIVSDP